MKAKNTPSYEVKNTMKISETEKQSLDFYNRIENILNPKHI